MTQDEFQQKYHNYITHDEEEARREAAKVNTEGIDDDIAVAVNFGVVGWSLMLKSSYDELMTYGLWN